jgi:hypothetical protein
MTLIIVTILMITMITVSLALKQKFLLWFGGFLALIWGIVMTSETSILGDVNYIWTVFGVGLFIACIILTITLNRTKKEISIDNEPEDIKEARIERENVSRQFQSIRITREGRTVRRNKYTGLRNG